MKIRIFSLMMVVCMLLCVALASCEGNTNEDVTTNNSNTTESTEADNNTTESESDKDESETVSDEPAITVPAYKVTVVDENGNAIEGAEVQLCIVGGMCLMPQFTGADGSVVIEAAEADYQATVRVDGAVVAEYVSFPEGSKELTVTVALAGDETDSAETDSENTESAENDTDATETN